MSKAELPDFIDPHNKAILDLKFKELDEGRSITPTEIRHSLPEALMPADPATSSLSKFGQNVMRIAKKVKKYG